MADKTNQAASGDVIGPESGMAVLDPATLATWESMFDAVPEAGGDGLENILSSLATATSAAELDAPWAGHKLEVFANVPLVIVAIRKVPSDYEGGLPYFLVIDAAIKATGEKVTVLTGAVSVVAQLVRAWAFEQMAPGTVFPLAVIPRIAKRPSASGFFPMHLDLAR